MNFEEIPINYEKNKRSIRWALIFAGVTLFLVLIVIGAVFIFGNKQKPVVQAPGGAGLPGDLESGSEGLDGDKLNGIKAEDIMFGHFYRKEEDSFRPSVKTYPLPTNVKEQAENYYDASRKINLEEHVADLNSKGYKIIANPYKDANDFFAVYAKLVQDDIPLIITSDFLMYYYQNNLKNVFDEIERNTFYKNVWNIYKDLYDIAENRYTERLARLGVSNDPILEGQRLETAYLAVVLKLLTPNEKQIAAQKSLNTHDKFTKDEALYFDFALPAYLEEDVNKELQLINKTKLLDRSPVLRYARDYSVFNVPREFKDDAKLNNFYLASRWLNSVFPLYFRTDDCKGCLLDKDDWLINFSAASYLAKDMSDSQANKNRWAIIYKFISFFTGLRQDLTFLEYNRALEKLYGKGYVIENIFSRANFTDIDIFKIQSEIEANKFSPIEGCYDRSAGKNPQIGMRMLQESYWPNDYIFSKLTGTDMKSNASNQAKREQQTLCGTNRCLGTALDIINLQVPLTASEKFVRESNYIGYDLGLRNLRDNMAGFNVFTWNTNIYWSSLDMINTSLKEDRTAFPVYMRSNEWFLEKELNMALGSWANIHVPKDAYATRLTDQETFTSLRPVCDLPNFVEPKLEILRESIARNNMLLEMMDVLNVSRDSNLAALDIEDVSTKFEHLIEIDKKILSGALLNYSDCSFIEGLVNNRKVIDAGKKSFTISQDRLSTIQRLNGVKLLVAMFTHGEDHVIAMGPVFDYSETMGRR